MTKDILMRKVEVLEAKNKNLENLLRACMELLTWSEENLRPTGSAALVSTRSEEEEADLARESITSDEN